MINGTINVNSEELTKMYILVNRKKLPLVHCAVHSSHSVAEYMNLYGNKPSSKKWADDHKTMVILEADEKEMDEVCFLFKSLNLDYAPFFEPDMDNCLTAIAFEPINKKMAKALFGKFPLLK